MSPLHIDFRPKTLREFFGNDSLKEILQLNLTSEDPPRVLLFSGTRGCGKTTLAYIVKDMMGCAEIDFHHLNISNTRGIDQARELDSNMRLRPMGGPIKIYLLNECQRATGDFWDCLLDALEFTPKHVVFILCTTNPDKLPGTVLSRCRRFEVKPLKAGEIRRLLNSVLEAASVSDFPKKAIEQISREDVCHGIPREALVILDKVVDILDERALLEAIESSSQESTVRELLKALLDKADWKDVASILTRLKEKDPEAIRWAVLRYCQAVLLEHPNRQAAILIECFSEPFFHTKEVGLTLACYQGVTHHAST